MNRLRAQDTACGIARLRCSFSVPCFSSVKTLKRPGKFSEEKELLQPREG